MKSNLNFLRKTTLVALGAFALSPAALFAADAPKSAAERGIIKSVDNSAHHIVVTDQKTKVDGTFEWNASTKFVEHGKSVDATALKAGQLVHVTYAPGSGTSVLERVTLSDKTHNRSAKSGSAHQKS